MTRATPSHDGNAAERAGGPAPSVVERFDPFDLPPPRYIWLTPVWFRTFVLVLAAIAAILVSMVLAHLMLGTGGPGAPDGGWATVLGVGAGLLAGAGIVRHLNPLDGRKWFRFAATRAGLFIPGRKSSLVFVPWSAVGAIDVERWYAKGEHSAARLTLELDETIWPRFASGVRIEGEGRIRRLSLQVADMTGEEIAGHIRACRADSPNPGG